MDTGLTVMRTENGTETVRRKEIDELSRTVGLGGSAMSSPPRPLGAIDSRLIVEN